MAAEINPGGAVMMVLYVLLLAVAMNLLLPLKMVLHGVNEVDRNVKPLILIWAGIAILFLIATLVTGGDEPDTATFACVFTPFVSFLGCFLGFLRCRHKLGVSLHIGDWCHSLHIGQASPCIRAFSLAFEAALYGPERHGNMAAALKLNGEDKDKAVLDAHQEDIVRRRHLQSAVTIADETRSILLANVVECGGTLSEAETAFFVQLTELAKQAGAAADAENHVANGVLGEKRLAKQAAAERRARKLVNPEGDVLRISAAIKAIFMAEEYRAVRLVIARILAVLLLIGSLFACLQFIMGQVWNAMLGGHQISFPEACGDFVAVIGVLSLTVLFLHGIRARTCDAAGEPHAEDEDLVGSELERQPLAESRHPQFHALNTVLDALECDAGAWPHVSQADRSFLRAAIIEPAIRMAEALAGSAAMGDEEAATLDQAITTVEAIHAAAQQPSAPPVTPSIIAKVMRDRMAERAA